MTEEEHRRARLVAAHAGCFLADLLRDEIDRRYTALGLEPGRRRMKAQSAP